MGDILKTLPPSDDPRLLVGHGASDDGAVYKLDNGPCLVQTMDFFTPIVDDPADFGAIAAANALSDIYAMGGRPLTALCLICYPYKTWPTDILAEINRGGAEKIKESGALVVGGHSVLDEEIKFGYAVTGTVPENNYWRNDTPRAGDALLLTKPLGTGILTTAVKRDALPADLLTSPVREMKRLNRAAAQSAQAYEVHAATDITGFGLLGHLCEMLRPQKLGAVIQTASLPIFDGVWDGIEKGCLTGARHGNKDYVGDYRAVENTAYRKYEQVLLDPQTSGGLLLALPSDQARQLLQALLRSNHQAALIGEITPHAAIHCE